MEFLNREILPIKYLPEALAFASPKSGQRHDPVPDGEANQNKIPDDPCGSNNSYKSKEDSSEAVTSSKPSEGYAVPDVKAGQSKNASHLDRRPSTPHKFVRYRASSFTLNKYAQSLPVYPVELDYHETECFPPLSALMMNLKVRAEKRKSLQGVVA